MTSRIKVTFHNIQAQAVTSASWVSDLCHVEVTSTNATANIQNLLTRSEVEQVYKLLFVSNDIRRDFGE